MERWFWRTGLLAVLFAVLSPVAAQAFDAQQFAPAVDPQGYFTNYSAKTAPRGRFYLAFWYNYVDDPLNLRLFLTHNRPLFPSNPYQDNATLQWGSRRLAMTHTRQTLLDHIHGIDLTGSYSITDWLELGLDIPGSKIASSVPGIDDGSQNFDDIQLNAKLQIKDPGTHGFGAAIVPFVQFPTGNPRQLTSNGKTNYGGVVVGEFVTPRFRVALNGGYKVNNKPFSDDDERDEILFGLGTGFLLVGEQPILGADTPRLELIGDVFGATTEKHPFDGDYNTPVEFLVGPRFWHPSGLQLGAAAGRRITESFNGADWRVVATIGYSWQPKLPSPLPPPPPPPPAEKVVVTEEQIITLEPIYFDFDKSTIKPVSYPLLDQVVKVMADRPSMRVRVEGHTDSKGADAYNQKLSQRRSESVVKYLIEKSIAPSRLDSVGFGESRPIAPNNNPDGSDNAAGRAKNRRTEFHVIAQ